MDHREKALAELKALIRRERARIDPAVLEKAGKAAAQQTGLKAQKPEMPAGMVPYDTRSAKEAIALFLEGHKDAASFQKRLLEKLRKTEH